MLGALRPEELAYELRHLIDVTRSGGGGVDPGQEFAELRRELAGAIFWRVIRHAVRLTRKPHHTDGKIADLTACRADAGLIAQPGDSGCC
jgi:hypothetical protein